MRSRLRRLRDALTLRGSISRWPLLSAMLRRLTRSCVPFAIPLCFVTACCHRSIPEPHPLPSMACVLDTPPILLGIPLRQPGSHGCADAPELVGCIDVAGAAELEINRRAVARWMRDAWLRCGGDGEPLHEPHPTPDQ